MSVNAGALFPEVRVTCTDAGMLEIAGSLDLGYGRRADLAFVLLGCLVLPQFHDVAVSYAAEWIKCGEPHCIVTLWDEHSDPPGGGVQRQEGKVWASLAADLIAQGIAHRDDPEDMPS